LPSAAPRAVGAKSRNSAAVVPYAVLFDGTCRMICACAALATPSRPRVMKTELLRILASEGPGHVAPALNSSLDY